MSKSSKVQDPDISQLSTLDCTELEDEVYVNGGITATSAFNKPRNCMSYQKRKLLQKNLNFENY